MSGPRQDRPSVTADGTALSPAIAGVEVRRAITHVDDRGELTEIFNPGWGVCPEPMVYAYQATVRPHKTKGWVVHREQHDRLFVSFGTLRFVLYDARDDSPTRGQVLEIYASERNRALVVIPPGVFHAVQNVGDVEAAFVNLPTRPYRYDDPDKYRLPLDTDQIPFRLDERAGG